VSERATLCVATFTQTSLHANLRGHSTRGVVKSGTVTQPGAAGRASIADIVCPCPPATMLALPRALLRVTRPWPGLTSQIWRGAHAMSRASMALHGVKTAPMQQHGGCTASPLQLQRLASRTMGCTNGGGLMAQARTSPGLHAPWPDPIRRGVHAAPSWLDARPDDGNKAAPPGNAASSSRGKEETAGDTGPSRRGEEDTARAGPGRSYEENTERRWTAGREKERARGEEEKRERRRQSAINRADKAALKLQRRKQKAADRAARPYGSGVGVKWRNLIQRASSLHGNEETAPAGHASSSRRGEEAVRAGPDLQSPISVFDRGGSRWWQQVVEEAASTGQATSIRRDKEETAPAGDATSSSRGKEETARAGDTGPSRRGKEETARAGRAASSRQDSSIGAPLLTALIQECTNVRGLMALVEEHSRSFDNIHAAAALNKAAAVSAQEQVQPAVVTRLVEVARPLVQLMQARQLAGTARAVAKLGHAAFVGALVQAATPKLGSFNAQDLAIMARALATLGHVDAAFMGALVQAATPKLGSFNAQDLAAMAWALAKLGYRNEVFMGVLLLEAKLKLSSFNIADMEQMSYALNKLNIRDAAFEQAGVRGSSPPSRPRPALVELWHPVAPS
jgi:hypothetical protein